ncbi:hypothetical protein FB45DRAFT_1145627, partial [Roridomyces roridus]
MSQAPPSEPWLERSRLDGQMLNSFVYGIFAILSVQAAIALHEGRKSARVKLDRWVARGLTLYIVVTFILGSIGYGANARYTEDIWINFRHGDWDPADLITNEFAYWYNRLAIDSYENYIMVWIMDLLLLYRCAAIWSFNIFVMGSMGCAYLAIVGAPVHGRDAENHTIFFKSNFQLGFLALSCAYNLLFTTLVTARLLIARNQITLLLGAGHAKPYASLTATLVESASLYFVFDLLFVITFALHSKIQNLILLENCFIQAIAQLLIILRVAKGKQLNSTIMS